MKKLNYDKIFAIPTKLRLAGQTKKSIMEYQRFLINTDPLLQIEAWNGIALCHKMEKNHPRTIKEFESAIKIAREIGFNQRLSGIYRDIAITYEYQRKYSSADRWYQKALNNLQEYGDKPLSSNPHWGITIGKRGLLQMRWGKLRAAKKMLDQGLAACQKGSADFYVLTLKMHLLELHNRQGQFAMTAGKIDQLIKEAQKKEWDHRQAQLLIIKAVSLIGLNKQKEANDCWRLMDKIIKKLDTVDMKEALLLDKKLQLSVLR